MLRIVSQGGQVVGLDLDGGRKLRVAYDGAGNPVQVQLPDKTLNVRFVNGEPVELADVSRVQDRSTRAADSRDSRSGRVVG